MLTIINDGRTKLVSITDLKDVLLKEYKILFAKDGEDYTLNILRDQNKRSPVNKILMQNKMTFEQWLEGPEYFVTSFDIILLANHYGLPIIILSKQKYGLMEYYGSQKMIPKNFSNIWITRTDEKAPKFYYIIRQSYVNQRHKEPVYKLLTPTLESLKNYVDHTNKTGISDKMITLIDKYRTQIGKGNFSRFLKNYDYKQKYIPYKANRPTAIGKKMKLPNKV